MRTRRANHPGAFTLIELILVLAILAIVAATVIPTLRVFAVGRSTNDTAMRIVGLANYARTQAVTEGRIYRLNLDPSKRLFWLTADADGAFQPPPAGDYAQQFEAGEGIQVWTDVAAQPPDGQYVEFRPTGRTDPARVRLTDRLGNTIEVACTSATELFRILSPEETPR